MTNIINSKLKCPDCKNPLKEDQDVVYPSKPASRKVFCEGCGFEGARTLGYLKEMVNSKNIARMEPTPSE